MRFVDRGTRSLTESMLMITHSNASAALNHGRAKKTSSEERRGITTSELWDRDLQVTEDLRGSIPIVHAVDIRHRDLRQLLFRHSY